MTLDFGVAPTGPFHDISELHRLEVHEDPEDGFTVLHPAACEVQIQEYEGFTWTDYQCMVSWHVESADYQGYRHGFDDPTPWNLHDKPLLPGIYTCWVEVVKHRCFDSWGGYEYDSVLHVEPQLALPVGPGWGQIYLARFGEDGKPLTWEATGQWGFLGWGQIGPLDIAADPPLTDEQRRMFQEGPEL